MQPAGKYLRERRGCEKRNGPFGFRLYTMVYAIDAPDIGRVKFGQTGNVERRFRGIANMSPAPLKLLGYSWLPADAEAHIFDFLKDDRCHGEWFHRTERVRAVAALVGSGKVIELAHVIGMGSFLVEHLPSGVAWGAH